MSNTVSAFRVHESTVSSLSITMVAVMAVAIVMLFRNTDVDYSPRLPSEVHMPVVIELSAKTQADPIQEP